MLPTDFTRFVTVSVGWAVYASIFFIRKPLSLLKADLDFDKEYLTTELGWLDFAFLLPLFLGQIFFENFLVFRFNKLKKWLLFSTVIACLPIAICFPLLALFPLLSEFTLFSFMLMILGLFQAFSWSVLSRIISLHLPPDDTNSAFGIVTTSSLGGAMAGIFATVYIQYTLGWMFAYTIPGVVNIVLAFIAFLFMTVPEDTKPLSLPQPAFVVPNKTATIQLGRSVKVVVISLSIFMVRFIRYALYMWVPYFLLDEAVHSQLAVGVIAMAFDLGGFFGTAFINKFAEKVFSRRIVFCALACNFWTSLAVGFFYAYSYSIGAAWIWLAIAGFVNSGADSLLSGPLSVEIGENLGMQNVLISFINGVGALGAIVEGPIFSLALKTGGWIAAFSMCIVLSIAASTLPLLFYPGIFHATSTSIIWQ